MSKTKLERLNSYFLNLDTDSLRMIEKIALDMYKIGLSETPTEKNSYLLEVLYDWENKYNFTRKQSREHISELIYLSTAKCNMIEYIRNIWEREKLEEINLKMKGRWFE